MKTKQTPSHYWANLVLLFSLFFGAIVRFAPTIMAGSPINDGGMFYVMIEDLKTNHFLLPAFTTYNHLNIPFAYPPLSFYIGGFLSSLGLSTLEIVRWLPPLVSTLSILAFYWMAGQMLKSKKTAVLSTLAYAMMPRTFSWYVMGGGLSRAFGVLFLLLACASAWTLFTRRSIRYVFLTALFGAGALLSHPETGLHTAAACFLIWLFNARSAHGLRDAVLVALGVFLLTAPWWMTVLSKHGLSPFLSALNTGGHGRLFWLPWLTVNFAEEHFITLLTVLGLIGIIVQGLRRDWFLLVWMLFTFAVEPRSATAIAALPLAVLTGLALADFILPAIIALSSKMSASQDWTEAMTKSGAVKIVFGYVMFTTLLGAFFYDLTLSRYHVSSESRVAMEWAHTNTVPGSQFIVLTAWTDSFADPPSEWFPVFAERASQNTIQGREWLLGGNFMSFYTGIKKLRDCLNDGPSCVENWADANRLNFDYIYIEKANTPALLSYLLCQSPNYTKVFENSGVVIFARK